MPKKNRASRHEAEGGLTVGLLSSADKSARRSSAIESSITAGGLRSTRRDRKSSTTKTIKFTQKMSAASEKSYRRPTTKIKYVHEGSKVEAKHRGHHRPREDESDSEDDYVYPRERRSKKETKPRYEEARRLGTDEGDDEAKADEKQNGQDIEGERRRLAERSNSSHHHRHHKYHHRGRGTVEEKRPKEHRVQRRQRTLSEQRERDVRKADRRAERGQREARESPPILSMHREKHLEPAIRPGIFSGIFKRTNSTPAPPVDRPQTRRSSSEPKVSRHRRESDEHDGGLPIVHEGSQKHKHKHERGKKKKKPTGFLGMFIPAIKEPKIEAPVKLVTCIVCLDEEVKSTRTKKLKCGHRQCHSCLRQGFKNSITDPQQMPPKCCTSEPIPLRTVDKLFPDQWKKRWTRKYEEYTTKNRIYCPAKKCGEWVRPEDIKRVEGKKQGICRKCKTKVCGTCNAKWHGARDCPKDAETIALLETARKAGWQRCYSCRTLVELKEGCNHMTCRCTAEFCMLCGLKWRTCECPWFNYEAVEADRLAHMRVPGDMGGGGRAPPPPPPPLFPRNIPNAFAAVFPPPRPAHQDQVNVPIAAQPINPFQMMFDQNLRDFGTNVDTNQDQVQERAQQRQERLRQQRQDFHQQRLFDERQQRMRAVEEIARHMENLNLTIDELAPRQRRQAIRVGSEAPAQVPASVQAGIARGQRGSRRVDMWMENVPFQPLAQPVR